MVFFRFATTTSLGISFPFLPFYVMQLGISNTAQVTIWSGVLSSVQFLMSAVFSPLWGVLSDRMGRKIMVVRSSAAATLALVFAGLCQNVWELFAVNTLAGIFTGFSGASMALVATEVPEERLGFSLGWLATGQLVGSLIGPLIGGALADQLHSYRAAYFVGAACSALTTVGTIVFIRERYRPVKAPVRAAPLSAQLGEIARHPTLIPLLAIMLLTQVTALAAQPVIPLVVRALVGGGAWVATAAGIAIAVSGLADVIASPWLGKRSDVIGYRRVLIISFIGAAAFTIPQAFAPNFWTFTSLRFGLGIFLGGILPSANALLARLFVPEERGRIFGLASSATFLGMFIGPLFGGLVAARFGFGSVFLLVGVLTLINLGFAFRLPEHPTGP